MKNIYTSVLDDVVSSGRVGGHLVTSVVARNECVRQRAKALQNLEDAIPDTKSFEQCYSVLERLSTTPDFHPGRPVPVGVVAFVRGAVLPHLIGNDIGCGMRLMVLDGITAEEIRSCSEIDLHLRHILFQGGRDIALTGRMRRGLLEYGLYGLLEELNRVQSPGLLRSLNIADCQSDLDRTCDMGSLQADGLETGFEDYAPLDDEFRRDAILGTLGGGNHFLEIGSVDRIVDGGFARVANIQKNSVLLCVHSGSLGFGQRVNATIKSMVHSLRSADKRILPFGTLEAQRYLTGLANAGNAAFANRFFLALSVVEALRRATGKDISSALVYDAPHNMAWQEDDVMVHRKGACPARGGQFMAGTPYQYYGEPVILPGSMGDGTWLLSGLGSSLSNFSSAHGAGRRLSRSEARKVASGSVSESGLRVIGPVDLNDVRLRGRADILSEANARLSEEAPNAYRPIDSVVEPMVQAGLVQRVARIKPILTAKG